VRSYKNIESPHFFQKKWNGEMKWLDPIFNIGIETIESMIREDYLHRESRMCKICSRVNFERYKFNIDAIAREI
jgi:hypothetical protein